VLMALFAVTLKVTSWLVAVPVQVNTFVFVAELYVRAACMLTALQVVSLITAKSVLLDVAVSV